MVFAPYIRGSHLHRRNHPFNLNILLAYIVFEDTGSYCLNEGKRVVNIKQGAKGRLYSASGAQGLNL
ncbi:unnamed protein product [Allacma fusca]|uniref:Uncharacterized protein n=1 Tax=Allacma fusca TaxID=39272 RepID=A0A8J2P712_9HEXA|nr:unnamed protein product [Allacma fusca]